MRDSNLLKTVSLDRVVQVQVEALRILSRVGLNRLVPVFQAPLFSPLHQSRTYLLPLEVSVDAHLSQLDDLGVHNLQHETRDDSSCTKRCEDHLTFLLAQILVEKVQA